jgi:hypothetical protein
MYFYNRHLMAIDVIAHQIQQLYNSYEESWHTHKH